MWWTDFCNQYFSVGVLPCSHNWLRSSVCAPPFLDEMKMMRTAATTLQDVRALRSFPGIHSLSKCFSLQFIVEGFDSGFLKYCWWVVGDVVANCPVGQNRSDSHTWGWWLVVALVALPSQRALGVVITLMEQLDQICRLDTAKSTHQHGNQEAINTTNCQVHISSIQQLGRRELARI